MRFIVSFFRYWANIRIAMPNFSRLWQGLYNATAHYLRSLLFNNLFALLFLGAISWLLRFSIHLCSIISNRAMLQLRNTSK